MFFNIKENLVDIQPNEMIHRLSYVSMCDYEYVDENSPEPPSGIVYCPIEKAHDFLSTHQRNKYVLVSGNSDFGLVRQSEHMANFDLPKRIEFFAWDDLVNRTSDFVGIQIGPCIEDENKCNIRDTYSSKSYAHTLYTFNELPPNIIRWFSVNLDTIHPRCEWLPMGLGAEHEAGLIYHLRGVPKQKSLLVNFQHYTRQRLALKQYFAEKNFSWVSYRFDPNLPQPEFMLNIAQHRFILCPAGNALDSYRIWQSLYSGSIPVMKRSTFTRHFEDLPVLIVDSYEDITEDLLSREYERIQRSCYQLNKLKLSYWKYLFNVFKGVENGISSC